MLGKACRGFLKFAALAMLATGCKRDAPSQPAAPPGSVAASGSFQTPYQSESQFIVYAVVSDLAEQMYFAVNHRLPETNGLSVSVVEKPDSPVDAPVYDLQIRLEQPGPVIKMELAVNGPIWSPGLYRGAATALAKAARLKAGAVTRDGDPELLAGLLDGTAATLEKKNQALSAALEKSFTNPRLHEQAALLLGAFALREHSGNFFEIRSPLSRMTAHLAMARFLDGDSPGADGRLAEAVLTTLMGDQATALNELKTLEAGDPSVAAMIRVLQMRNTGDYRLLAKVPWRSQAESVAWFSAMADYAGAPAAWQRIDDQEKQTVDFARVAHEEIYSVEMGHVLLGEAIPLELQEDQIVYELSQGKKLDEAGLVAALNEPPERCFSPGPGGNTQVRVIGWGQWAMFLQRHLCHAVQQNFQFMYRKWSVPEDAKEFAAKCDQHFDGLRLYPFVRRFNSTNEESYHQSEDDAFKVTSATPQLVPAACWNYLGQPLGSAPRYKPERNPRTSEWHNHSPPPGTVYNLGPRLGHTSLIRRRNALGRFEQLHELAPYDVRIVNIILEKKYAGHPTYEQAMGLFQTMLPWSVSAMRIVAQTVYDQPERYEELMLKAAEWDPSCYYDLGEHARRMNQEDKAAQFIGKGCDMDPDAIRIASHAEWRVGYYLRKGQTAKAREIADFAGDVYSWLGLNAKAYFLEATTNYDGAYEWYAKIEERYNDSMPLINFCLRCDALTGDARYGRELKRRADKMFPKGMEKVSPSDFHRAPVDGVLIAEQNELLTSAHLKKGDVIVALQGVRVHSLLEYSYLRDVQESPQLDLIVWQGEAFHEIKASPPKRRFGVKFGDYKPNQAADARR